MFGLPAAGDALVHGLWVGLGLIAGALVFFSEKRRRGMGDDRLWAIAGMCLFMGAVGSRMGTWLQETDLSRNANLLDWWVRGNRSILGGLVGAWIGVHLGKLITRYPERTGDLFAPAVALSMAIGRIGCLFTELPGTPTGENWGMVLSPAQVAILGGRTGVGLHPSFAYEMAFHAIAFAWLWRHRDRLPRSGDLFIVYVAAYAAFRFGVEFVRGNEVVWAGLTRPQLFLGVTLPLLGWRLWRVWHPRPVAGEPAPARVWEGVS